MLIVLIWLGSLFPEKYFNVIEKCEEYPQNQCVILGEGHWVHYLKKYRSMLNVTDDRINRMLMVERADVLRLLYLYDKGGIYTDLDNDIDYPCLYDLIGTRNESFFSQEQRRTDLPSNNLIFSPKPRDPKIQRVINLIQECPTCDGLNFASPWFLERITVDFVNVQKCVNHLYHSTWFWWGDLEGQNISPASAQAYAKCVKDLGNCQKNCTLNSSAQLTSLSTLQDELYQEPIQKSFKWTVVSAIIAFIFLFAVLTLCFFFGLLFERRKSKKDQNSLQQISSGIDQPEIKSFA